MKYEKPCDRGNVHGAAIDEIFAAPPFEKLRELQGFWTIFRILAVERGQGVGSSCQAPHEDLLQVHGHEDGMDLKLCFEI